MRKTLLRPVDVAREFNRSADWLRGLEREGIIPQAPRDFAGRRIYSEADLETIRRILLERQRVPAA